MIEGAKIQFQHLLGEVKAFVNGFLGEENETLSFCFKPQCLDHFLECSAGCTIKKTFDEHNQSILEKDLLFVLNELNKQHKQVAYVDYAKLGCKSILERCDLRLHSYTADEAYEMALKLIELQVVSLIVVDNWIKMPLKVEAQVVYGQDFELERHLFFEKRESILRKKAEKHQVCLLFIHF